MAKRKKLSPKILKGLSPLHVRPTVFVDMEFLGFGKTQPIVDVGIIKDRSNGETEYYESKLAVTEYQVENAEQGAIDVIGFTHEEWRNAPPRFEVIQHVWNMTAGCAWVGLNVDGDMRRAEGESFFVDEHAFTLSALGGVGWDLERLRAEIDAAEIPIIKRPWCPIYDVAHMARLMLPDLENYKLETLCRHFGIEEEQEHRAMGGAMRVRSVFYALIGAKR